MMETRKLPNLQKGFFRGVWPYPGVDVLIEQHEKGHGEKPAWIVLSLKEFTQFLRQKMGWEQGQKVPDVVEYEGVHVCWKQNAANLCYVGKGGEK